MITVSCQACSADLEFADADAGTATKCPKCQAVVELPATGATDTDTLNDDEVARIVLGPPESSEVKSQAKEDTSPTFGGESIGGEGNTKKCPFCGQLIEAMALKCRFCDKSVTPVSRFPPETCGLATTSYGFVMGGAVLGALLGETVGWGLEVNIVQLLAGVPAVVCGHLAMKQIGREPQTLRGRRWALFGIIGGYIGIIYGVLTIVRAL